MSTTLAGISGGVFGFVARSPHRAAIGDLEHGQTIWSHFMAANRLSEQARREERCRAIGRASQ